MALPQWHSKPKHRQRTLFSSLQGSQLHDIISRAIQPLHNEVRDLKAIVANLEGKVSALEATQDLHAENQFIQLQLINNLRDALHKEPQPLQKDRGEILRALLALMVVRCWRKRLD